MLGDDLKKLREQRGFSQEDVARALGTTQQTIQRIESGKSPHSGYIESMEAFLKASSGNRGGNNPDRDSGDDGGPHALATLNWITIEKFIRERRSRIIKSDSNSDLVPVLGMDSILEDQARLNYNAISYINRSDPIQYSSAPYAIKISANDMSPSLKQSEIALVNPDLSPMLDEPHIFLHKHMEDNHLKVIIANLQSLDGKNWKVIKFSPFLEYDIERESYPVCHRIVGRFSLR